MTHEEEASPKRAKVFIPQIPSRRDPATKIWVPTINIKPAEEFGDIVELLPAGSQFFPSQEMKRLIKQRLHEEDLGADDYFIAAGSPTAMMVTAAIAARRLNGCLNILLWDGATSTYSAHALDNLV